MSLEGRFNPTRWQRLGRGHQVARRGRCARWGWRHQVARCGRRARWGWSGWWRRDQVAGRWRDCGFAAGARSACCAEHAAIFVAWRRIGAARRRCHQVAGGLGLVPASRDVVDGRHADRRDQQLSRLAGLSHGDSKAHSRSRGCSACRRHSISARCAFFTTVAGGDRSGGKPWPSQTKTNWTIASAPKFPNSGSCS